MNRLHRSSVATQCLVVFLLAACAHFFFASDWLDDRDSINFVLGVEELDIARHQPHPPGYAAYIYLARLLDLGLQDPETSLKLLSIASGAASVALIFVMGRLVFNPGAAWLGAGILLLAPTHFHMSLVAMTDVVVEPFFLGALALLIMARPADSRWHLALLAGAGLLSGWGVGIRPQWAFLFGLVVIFALVTFRRPLHAGVIVFAGLAGTFAWLIPASAGKGGIGRYYELSRSYLGGQSTGTFNFGWQECGELVRLLVHRWDLSLGIYTGLAAISMVGLLLRRPGGSQPVAGTTARQKRDLVFMTIWFLVAAFTALAFHPARYQRILIPLLSPLALLLSVSICAGFQIFSKSHVRKFLAAVVVLGLGASAVNTYNLAEQLSRSVPAPIQAAMSIRQGHLPGNAFLLAGSSFRHWRYYLPEFTVESAKHYRFPDNGLEGFKVLLSDVRLHSGVPARTDEFSRSREIYYKHYHVNLHRYEAEEINLILQSGAFPVEKRGFWISELVKGWLRNGEIGTGELTMVIRSFNRPRALRIAVDGDPVWEESIGTRDTTLRISVPVDRSWSELTMSTVDGCQSPAETHGAKDRRCLSFHIAELEVADPGPQGNNP